MARRGGRRVVAPEIDAQMNSINEDQVVRVQTRALMCADLVLKISENLLIPPVSTVVECSSEA